MKGRAAPAAGAATNPKAFDPRWLALRLRQLAGPLAGARFCLAYSGGADSSALLAAMAALRGRHRLQLRAVHVDHRMQPSAAGMARAARARARGLGVACRVVVAPVQPARGASPEATARAVRYAALHSGLRQGEWLLLAQHQDDQAESLLLQLLRGAGIAGIAAMPARAGSVLRPLLDVAHSQLVEYLRRRGISWTEDPSNADERFDRNYLRRRVLPLVRARWPTMGVTLGRSAALAAEAQGLLAETADALLRPAWDGAALRISVLRRLGAAQRRNALRRWLERQGLPMPDQRRLQEIAGPLLQARQDAQPRVHWNGGEVRRHGDCLYATAPLRTAALPPRAWRWRHEPRFQLADGAWLELCPDPHGSWQARALPDRLQVAFRGLDGRVAGLPGGKRLKGLLQAAGVPPWSRIAVPLLYARGRLIAVGDQWQAPEEPAPGGGASAGRRAVRLRLRWHAAER
ncbi:MAG TPA: tRNA lysidine(34) synthetase TilS [Steroidobacteraceae bacterium]|nr:tRNA lysidine(34) synthetase TilS [Steroidobacteraceae bacterium]